MTITATIPNPASPPLGSERQAVRDRHHYRARAVAQGLPFPGSPDLAAIYADDPAFQNLVELYRRHPE